MKDALNATVYEGYAERLALEARLQHSAMNSADFREGAQAFLERREPRFTGR